MSEIMIKELVRAGDVILVKYDCPSCGSEHFTSFDEAICSNCGFSYINSPFNLEGCNKRNLVAFAKRNNRKQIKKKDVVYLLNLQEYCCAYCDANVRETSYHVDHIMPLAAGGTNNLDNLAIACPACNLKASSLVFLDLLSKRVYLRSKRFEYDSSNK